MCKIIPKFAARINIFLNDIKTEDPKQTESPRRKEAHERVTDRMIRVNPEHSCALTMSHNENTIMKRMRKIKSIIFVKETIYAIHLPPKGRSFLALSYIKTHIRLVIFIIENRQDSALLKHMLIQSHNVIARDI